MFLFYTPCFCPWRVLPFPLLLKGRVLFLYKKYGALIFFSGSWTFSSWLGTFHTQFLWLGFSHGLKHPLISWQIKGYKAPWFAFDGFIAPKLLLEVQGLHLCLTILCLLFWEGSAHIGNELKQLPKQLLNQRKQHQARSWKVCLEPDRKPG